MNLGSNAAQNPIRGVIPALITPFDQQEQLDEQRLRRITRELLESGVNGLYLTGSTGEAFLMTHRERNRVIELVLEEVAGRVPVIAHIGDVGTKKSIALAQEAQRLGVDAISSVPPFYWRFKESEIYEYYTQLAASTQLPLIIYNIPLAGLMGASLVARLAGIAHVAGVKFTATAQYEITWLKQKLGADFRVYSGCDEMGCSGLLYGADGLIGSFYNLMPELYLEIVRCVQAGLLQRAVALQKQADLIIEVALQYSYVSVIKIAMGWKGTDGGYCRSPFENCWDRETALREEFRRLRDANAIHGVQFLDAL